MPEQQSRGQHHRTGLPSAWGLFLVAVLAACGSDSSNGQTVAVNLSLVVDARQAHHRPAVSRLFAWIERWFPVATPAWAQSVSEIASIQVQITGPGIPISATTTVPVSNPTSGQEIPVSIQAPVGPNRTITVLAFNAESPSRKIFGGALAGVNLTGGAPINLEITIVRLFTVTVQKQGDGSGTVTSTPSGIDCGGICVNQFQEGTTVSLNAAAAPGSAFAGWSGDCSGTGACNLTGNATVTARFIVPISTDRLTVSLGGTGTGTVTSNPSGISCPRACAADFATGITVTITATPTNGSTFAGWSGGGCSGTGPCIVAMVGNPTVTATFTAAPSPSVLLRLYEHHDFNQGPPPGDRDGLEIHLDTSWQNLGEVKDKNGNTVIFNDKLTSLHLANGYRAEFFEHIDYQGKHFDVPSTEFPYDTRELPGGGNWPNDNVSSVKLFKPNSVLIPQPTP